MRFVVSGIDCEGKRFSEALLFTMVPPEEGVPHYGTGYYMTVKTPFQTHLIDVRYERTTDVKELALRWIRNNYGVNAHDIKEEK